jgi:uncharacterized protein YkwD
MIRRGAGFLLAACVLLAAQVAGALAYYPAGPQGTVGVSRPTISQQMVLESGDSILGAQMWLDGIRVQPIWDGSGLVRYTPSQPMAPGPHTVELSVDVAPAQTGFSYDPVVSKFKVTVGPEAVAVLPGPGPEELRALEQVNKYRQAAGLPGLSYSPALGAAALGHARYLAANPGQETVNAHREQPGTPLYVGTTSEDRARYYGYIQHTAEVINYTDRAEMAVAGWMDTLYHRIPLIHPGNQVFGYGLAGHGHELVNVALTGPDAPTPLEVRWPQPGQTDVPTGWDGAEHPDPMALYPGAPKPVGYTVTLTFGGPVVRLSLTAGTLTGPAGAVGVMTFDPRMDANLTDTVALIPRTPLAPGTTYTVRFVGRVDQGKGLKPFDRSWSFTTQSDERPILNERTVSSIENAVTRIGIDGSGFAPGLRAFLGGLPVEALTVEPGLLTFKPPVGYSGGAAGLLVVTPGGGETAWPDFFDGEESYRFPDRGNAFTPVPLQVFGQDWDVPALRHASGAVLVPGDVLLALGASRETVPELGRTYWQLGGVSGDYTEGRTAAAVGGRMFNLDLPVQVRNGTTYVDAGFVRQLAPWAYSAGENQILLGMADIGNHWARPAILRLLRAGVITGTGDGRFRPDDTLTRAAFVKMLVQARKLGPAPGDAGGFADTAPHWIAAQGYIGAAVKAGIVVPGEYAGRQFEPELPIAREEMAVMVARALGLDGQAAARTVAVTGGSAVVAGKTFTDASTWSRPGYIAVAMEQAIFNGYPEPGGQYTFQPSRPATRAEAAVMVDRLPGR